MSKPLSHATNQRLHLLNIENGFSFQVSYIKVSIKVQREIRDESHIFVCFLMIIETLNDVHYTEYSRGVKSGDNGRYSPVSMHCKLHSRVHRKHESLISHFGRFRNTLSRGIHRPRRKSATASCSSALVIITRWAFGCNDWQYSAASRHFSLLKYRA